MPKLEDIPSDGLVKAATNFCYVTRAYSPQSHPTGYYINLSMWFTLAKLGVVFSSRPRKR